jgi:hypothetical protein
MTAKGTLRGKISLQGGGPAILDQQFIITLHINAAAYEKYFFSAGNYVR